VTEASGKAEVRAPVRRLYERRDPRQAVLVTAVYDTKGRPHLHLILSSTRDERPSPDVVGVRFTVGEAIELGRAFLQWAEAHGGGQLKRVS
jgi:hypothetical protein